MLVRTITPKEYLQAASDGKLDVINQYIADNVASHAMLIVVDDLGETALWKAAIARNVPVVKALIGTGAVFKNVEQMISILRDQDAGGNPVLFLYGYRDRLKLLEFAQRFDIDEINTNHQKITLLSDKNYFRLQLLFDRLEKSGRLTAQSILRAFHLVTNKIPKPDKCEIQTTHQDEYAFLWYFFHREAVTIVNVASLPPIYYHAKDIDHRKVRKGYLDQQRSNMQPDYLIKNTHRAAKEAKCYKLLGQLSFFNETLLVTKWHQGSSLLDANRNDIMALSTEMRLHFLKMTLFQLNTLHKNYRSHGDVKPGNVVLDFINKSVYLIDFETMKKPYFMDFTQHGTPPYESPTSPREVMSEDMYGLGFVCASLFPDIFSVTLKGKKFEVELAVPSTSLSITDKSIVKLLLELQNQDCSARCTSEQALEYCDEVIVHLGDLDAHTLDDIANKTISRCGASVTTEDILRGYVSRL